MESDETNAETNEMKTSVKLPLFVCCLLGLWTETFGTWLVNTYLYPRFLSLLPEARDLASIAGIATLALLALIVRRNPASLDDSRLTIGSLCVYGFGSILVLLGLWENSAPLLALGASLRSVGSRWFLILVGVALCRLSGRACMLCIAGAYTLDYLLRFPVSWCGFTFAIVLVFALPLLALAVAHPCAVRIVNEAKESPALIDVSVTEPSSCVSFGSVLFLAIFAFRIAYGFALSFETVDGVPQQSALSFIPILLILILALRPKSPKADVLYIVSCLLIIAGFMSVVMFRGSISQPFAPFTNGLLFVGSECFDMLMYFTLAAIGARNKPYAVAVFAWGRATSSFGLWVGVLVGHIIADMTPEINGTIVIGCVLFVFITLNLTLLKFLKSPFADKG